MRDIPLRWSFGLTGLAVTKSTWIASDSNNANRDTLKRMANAGMDVTAVHAIDFLASIQNKRKC
jgi:hypothetical protein